jgi:WASH complex subunit 7
LPQAYDDELYGMLRSGVLEPLCRAVEADLRLHQHSATLPPAERAAAAPRDVSPLLRLRPLRLVTRVVDPRWRID